MRRPKVETQEEGSRMRKEPTETRSAFPILVLACLTLGLTTQARAECTSKTYNLSLPDRATLKLPDGEHSIGSVQTAHGSLEARVSVKGKDVSAPRFLIAGRPLREVSESALPQGLRDCLKKPSTPDSWMAKAIRSTLDWLVAPAHAESVSSRMRDDWYFTELCFKGTNAQQVCTYKACYVSGLEGTTTCKTLFVTGV